MRAIVMQRAGGPEVLRMADVPMPVPAEGEVLVRTEAIGASFTETLLRSGHYPMPVPLPAVFGLEAAGTVAAVGAGVPADLVGKRVAVLDQSAGTYAEYVASPVTAAVEIPEALSAQAAVAVSGMAATAYALVEVADLGAGETVLVESAAGQVGGYLVQLARRRGVRVVGTVGSAAKAEVARRRGVDVVVDHSDPGWPKRVPAGIDVVFESIGGSAASELLDVLTAGSARILVYGAISGVRAEIDPAALAEHGVRLIDSMNAEWAPKVFAARSTVLAMAAAGELQPVIDSTLPLAEAAEAHRRFDAREAAGKIILVP